jgi:tRNA pseudouridine13 synthase
VITETSTVDQVDQPVVKFLPEDFRVTESVTLPLCDGAAGKYQYLRLRKRGITTFAAIGLTADQLSVDPLAIGYGGLKDEDGVTEQVISVPAGAFSLPSLTLHQGDGSWLDVADHGSGPVPIRIGELAGNGFRWCVRNLPERTAEALDAAGPVDHFFINYYDTQRFGVPGGPKQTHLIGHAVLRKDWAMAFALLRESGSPEGQLALAYAGLPEGFFESLDPRKIAFYCSSWASHEWNAELTRTIAEDHPGQYREVLRDGIGYLHLRSTPSVLRLLAAAPALPCQRYRWDGAGIAESEALRTTVVQTRIQVGEPLPDEHFPGRERRTLSFFLPSGCYATAAISQLWSRLHDRQH